MAPKRYETVIDGEAPPSDALGLFFIEEAEDDWHVWIGLPNHTSVFDCYTFIIGTGATRDEAAADAVKALEGCLERLQAPRGVIEEQRQL